MTERQDPMRICRIARQTPAICLRFSLLCLAVSLAGVAHGQVRRALLIGIEDYAPPQGVSLPVAPVHHAHDSRFAPGTTWVRLQGPSADVAGMQYLLTNRFGFKDVRVLDPHQATRQGIIDAIDKLISDTHPGDFDVIFYAGHGSRRLDSLSSKNHFDETIVPIDAWKGVEDIRDKELAARFNRIVYDRHAHLTAIFDSCNSGTMARGVSEAIVRALPYDDRDVAEEKAKSPQTIVESDLKQIPQNGDAIIVAAAASDESAVEALYADDLKVHGAFTRALVRVLQASSQTLSAEDVVAAASAMMHADHVPFQQPSVEGRSKQSLFGDPVATHALHVHVSKVSADGVVLDVGSAAGFDAGTQFKSAAATGNESTLIEVSAIDGPLVSTAHVISGPAAIRVGAVFELTQMVYPQTARLVIFASQADPDANVTAERVRSLFPGLSWVKDPTNEAINFLVVNGKSGWVAYQRDGRIVGPKSTAQGAAFMVLGPSPSLQATIEQSELFQSHAFRLTQDPSEADYLLAVRIGEDGRSEHSLVDPIVLTPRDLASWVHGSENDPDDAALNAGVPPDVVCRNEFSLPIRTAWLAADGNNADKVALALLHRIVRVGRLRSWQQSAGIAPGTSGWPYSIEIVQPSSNTALLPPLKLEQSYEVRLATTAEKRSSNGTSPKYVYLMGIDCAANAYLLYPAGNLNGSGPLPQPGPKGVYPLAIPLGVKVSVAQPLGSDTFFLLATEEKLAAPEILVDDGILGLARGTAAGNSRGVQNNFDRLIMRMSGGSARGIEAARPTSWMVQQLVVPSRP